MCWLTHGGRVFDSSISKQNRNIRRRHWTASAVGRSVPGLLPRVPFHRRPAGRTAGPFSTCPPRNRRHRRRFFSIDWTTTKKKKKRRKRLPPARLSVAKRLSDWGEVMSRWAACLLAGICPFHSVGIRQSCARRSKLTCRRSPGRSSAVDRPTSIVGFEGAGIITVSRLGAFLFQNVVLLRRHCYGENSFNKVA